MNGEAKPWWQTFPAIVGGVAALITAVTGLLLALNSMGLFKQRKAPTDESLRSQPIAIYTTIVLTSTTDAQRPPRLQFQSVIPQTTDAQDPLHRQLEVVIPPKTDTEEPSRRQLDYANALFARKLYDLAIPEYQKYFGDYPAGTGQPSAYFFLGECYRALGKISSARRNFQRVVDDFSESEFVGPSAYGLAEIAFTRKDYAMAAPLFHRAAKSTVPSIALSARYFEARCLESLDRKDQACDIYQQVIEGKNPNPYRNDAQKAVLQLHCD